ncbi:site-specific integrase [Sphingomonas sp. MA1305]|uniref:tyrosine-type recombinase/integrase n=1 Tax=Sphingomonas sp. MA1305 TaxID=2479204 RepID=UPI0018DFB327|nr:site-specific integrase [Sphingomonas sp. MA1305]MBI0477483.1 site-specific integrase [Sphingomonas sp. MA1305]
MALKFARLTRPAIRALAIGEKLAEHGITAERQSNGDVRYTVNIMVDGQRIHRVVGRDSEGVTREQAERAIETFRTKAREGRLDLPTGRKNHRTFAEAATEYIQRLEDTGGKNMKAKRYHVGEVLKPYFGTHRADRVSSFLVQHFVRDRLASGLKQATVNRELATLSHMFRRMAKWGWIKAEAIPEIEKGAEPRKLIVVLSDENAAKLMKAAVADQDGLLWLFVAFGLNTAMRHSEILRVRFDQIDFDSRRIFIPQAKAGEREQPITPALADMLVKQRAMVSDTEGYVFPSKRAKAKHPHRISMADQFQRAVVRAGLLPSKVTPHVMRHTAITRLVRAGVDLPTIQRISGHKTLAMVLRYVHIHGQHIDDAIAAIDSAFPDAITPELHTGPLEGVNNPAKVVGISAAKRKG